MDLNNHLKKQNRTGLFDNYDKNISGDDFMKRRDIKEIQKTRRTTWINGFGNFLQKMSTRTRVEIMIQRFNVSDQPLTHLLHQRLQIVPELEFLKVFLPGEICKSANLEHFSLSILMEISSSK